MMKSPLPQPFVNPVLLMPANVWREYISTKISLFEEIENLPEDETLVLALHYYEGLSFAEIGQFLGIEEWAAVALHGQAYEKLQSKLEELHS